MDEATVRAMAERVASRSASYMEAPTVPPPAELVSILAACEDRLGLITHHVVVGNLPEKSLQAMREQVWSAARSACAELRQTLSEMEFILASVGLVMESGRGSKRGSEGAPC